MILKILGAARRLDETLNQKLGRPYHAFLSIVLIVEIVRRMQEFLEIPYSNTHVVQLIFPLMVGVALLINQLGELSKRMDNRQSGGRRTRSSGL